jgi:hypothetical protein
MRYHVTVQFVCLWQIKEFGIEIFVKRRKDTKSWHRRLCLCLKHKKVGIEIFVYVAKIQKVGIEIFFYVSNIKKLA